MARQTVINAGLRFPLRVPRSTASRIGPAIHRRGGWRRIVLDGAPAADCRGVEAFQAFAPVTMPTPAWTPGSWSTNPTLYMCMI